MTAIVSGCASQPKKNDCNKDYAYTLPHCDTKRKPTREEMIKAGYVEVCRVYGARRHCGWVHRDDLRRYLEGL